MRYKPHQRFWMRVLVVGSLGNMGRRYCSIVKYLGHDLVEYDLKVPHSGMPELTTFDSAIVATPVSEHTRFLKMLMTHVPVVCEKPISFDLDQVKMLANYANQIGSLSFMVNNWAFVGEHRYPMSEPSIIINTYNTGTDGDFDLIQPLYLVEDIENFICVRDYPGLYCEIGGKIYNRDDFDLSYIEMCKVFFDGDYKKLWPLENINTPHKRVFEYMELKRG